MSDPYAARDQSPWPQNLPDRPIPNPLVWVEREEWQRWPEDCSQELSILLGTTEIAASVAALVIAAPPDHALARPVARNGTTALANKKYSLEKQFGARNHFLVAFCPKYQLVTPFDPVTIDAMIAISQGCA